MAYSQAGSGHRIGPGGTGVKAKSVRPDQWMEAGRRAPPVTQLQQGPSLDSRRHTLVLQKTGEQEEGILGGVGWGDE